MSNNTPMALSPHCLVAVLVISLAATWECAADDAALRDVIDREIQAAWKKENRSPPAMSSDAVFLRRIYLDLVGMIPTYEETSAFLSDTDPRKREKLIDNLLADPRYARNQAHVWDLTLLGRNPQHVGHRNNRQHFRRWLMSQFQKNEPYDRFVHKLLTAEEDGTQLFYVVNRSSDDLSTATLRHFLGIQLQCAKCHDHPFDSWTQRDYYGMTGFFVRTFVVEGEEKDGLKRFYIGEKSTGEVNFAVLPQDAKPGAKGQPVKPKFLGGEELSEPELPKDFKEPETKQKEPPPKPYFSRREKLIAWIVSAENPYFAQAAANRVWAQFMGRGLVHPVDEFNQGNPASHPELLLAIRSQFIAHQFDLKWLIREIVNSQAYQTSDSGPSTDSLPEFYERARVRPLSAEELLASLHIALGHGEESALRAEPSEQMLKCLGEPVDGAGAFQGSVLEHLYIHNGDEFRRLCQPKPGNLAQQLSKGDVGWEAKVEHMFLSVLNRPPTSDERVRFVGYLQIAPTGDAAVDARTQQQRIEEALWVLVACSEFRFNR